MMNPAMEEPGDDGRHSKGQSVPTKAAEPDALHDVAALLAEQLSACHAAGRPLLRHRQ